MPAAHFRPAILAAAFLTACATTPASYEQRMQDTYAFIEAWERALEGGAEDRGWSMLSDSGRRGFDDEEQYVALAEAADWSAFDLTPQGGFCDDLYACSIGVLVPQDRTSIPAFLLESPRDGTDNSYRLIGIADENEDGAADPPQFDLGNAWMSVWWERVPWPDPGIGGGGG